MYKSKLLLLSLITVLYGCDNYDYIEETDIKLPQNATVNGAFITPLPSNAVAGDIYPVAFSASLHNQLNGDVEDLIETTNLSIESSSIDCLSSGIENNYLCTVSLRAKPIRNGMSAVSLQIDGATFTSQSMINDSAIIGYTKTNISKSFTLGHEKFQVGQSYPIEFVFVNIGQQQANDISLKSLTGTSLTNVKSNCGSSLASESACHIHGEYTPTSKESNGIQYQLEYDEGAPVVLGVQNIAGEPGLFGEVVTGLPLNIGVDSSYDVEFNFKNKGQEPVSNLTTQLLAPGASEIRSDNCKGATLAVGESCSITASVLADHIGTLSVLMAVSDNEKTNSYATVTSNVVESPVVAYVEQDLPQNMALDAPYHYLVTFSNSSKSHDATGIRFAHLYPESYDVLSDTCTDSTLRAEESCHISVATSTQTPGVLRYSSYLSFDQGTAVIASSTLSKASERSIESKVDVNFPTNMVLNHSYPFHVTFTNTGKVDSGELELSSSTPDGVTVDYNSCEGTLAPGESCKLSGEYYTTVLGPVRLEGTLNYGPQQVETFTLSGEVVSVPIEGTVKVGLPHNIGLNNTYPITYTYRNLSDSNDATMVGVTLSSTAPVHVMTNTCAASKVLHAGEVCEISGEFTANEQGQHQFLSSLRYQEGNEVKIQSTAMVSDVVVSSQIEGVSDLVALNERYIINYTFKNESHLDATGVQVSHSDEITVLSNSCSTNLNHGSECLVEVEYTPTELGYRTYHLTFDYIEGESIELTQPVKVVEMIELDEAVFESGVLTHSFDASEYFDYRANYGFTMRTSLQTIPVSGNPESVVYDNSWGSTPLVFELTPSTPINFIAIRRNRCGTATMNTSIGCAGKVLPEFVLTISQTEFDSLLASEYNGEIYLSLAQSNNIHVAIFKMPLRVIKR